MPTERMRACARRAEATSMARGARALHLVVATMICLTGHASSGVTLLAAPLAGARGREGNTVGTYICADLACSLYVRGKKVPESGGRFEESLTLEEQIARTTGNLTAFLDKLFD